MYSTGYLYTELIYSKEWITFELTYATDHLPPQYIYDRRLLPDLHSCFPSFGYCTQFENMLYRAFDRMTPQIWCWSIFLKKEIRILCYHGVSTRFAENAICNKFSHNRPFSQCNKGQVQNEITCLITINFVLLSVERIIYHWAINLQFVAINP